MNFCSTELSDDTSAVPSDMREKVLREYGVAGQESVHYELDYLISPQLGGTEDISNLWPEPSASTIWNLRAKMLSRRGYMGWFAGGTSAWQRRSATWPPAGSQPTKSTSTRRNRSSRCSVHSTLAGDFEHGLSSGV